MKVHTFIYGVITVLQLNIATVLGGYSSANAYGYNWYADTMNSTYDGYQQAWRYLGHMIKCGYPTARYYEQNSHSHSGDNNQYRGNNWCQRYLIWAAVSCNSQIFVATSVDIQLCVLFRVGGLIDVFAL